MKAYKHIFLLAKWKIWKSLVFCVYEEKTQGNMTSLSRDFLT